MLSLSLEYNGVFGLPSYPFQPKQSQPQEVSRLGVSVHMNSRNGSFGFQVVGGVGTGIPPKVEFIVPGMTLMGWFLLFQAVHSVLTHAWVGGCVLQAVLLRSRVWQWVTR